MHINIKVDIKVDINMHAVPWHVVIKLSEKYYLYLNNCLTYYLYKHHC